MKWYELNETERIKSVYSKYSIKDFWEWWENKEDKIMEIRIQDYKILKQIANQLQLNYSTSGVNVSTAKELKNVIALVRKHNVTAWFGINSRKKNWSANGNRKTFGSGRKGGSSDFNVKNIEFIFIDIDRKNKTGQATKKDLEQIDIVSNEILKSFEKQKWINRVAKICSGNGVQLLIGLDINFLVPEVDYDNGFIVNSEFEKIRNLIKLSIGKQTDKFAKYFLKKYMEEHNIELNVEIDTKCFNLSRVGSLPFTKNYKYDGFTWRGILELKNGLNSGISDYILLNVKDKIKFKKINIFETKGISLAHRFSEDEFINHPVIRLMLEVDLPYGEINNVVWFMVKALMQQNGLNFSMPKIREILNMLEKKYKGRFTENFPNKSVKFNEDTINNYCIRNMIPPVFEIKKTRGMRKLNNMLAPIVK